MSSNNDPSTVLWRKSSYSNGSGGDCVEVASNLPHLVPVRDSKRDPTDGPVLVFPAGGWDAFLDAVKHQHI
jgi:hypothetical protein